MLLTSLQGAQITSGRIYDESLHGPFHCVENNALNKSFEECSQVKESNSLYATFDLRKHAIILLWTRLERLNLFAKDRVLISQSHSIVFTYE